MVAQHCRLLSYTVFPALVSSVLAHGSKISHDLPDAAFKLVHGMAHDMSHHAHQNMSAIDGETPLSYYNHPEYAVWMYAHIGLMVVAWVLTLPIAVFLSTAKSHLAIPVQFLFAVVNALGILVSVVYDTKTPDLYPNNAHHKAGWAVTWIAVVWILLGLLNTLNLRKQPTTAGSSKPSPYSFQPLAECARSDGLGPHHNDRWSHDSGHGTESSSTGTSRTNSPDGMLRKPELPSFDPENEDPGQEDQPFLGAPKASRLIPRRVLGFRSDKGMAITGVLHTAIERFQPLLAFLALTTGFVTWWGIFRPGGLFNGLAHWIKGGIFFWYGLLTLGRWMGAFSSVGWAWNIRPEYPFVSKAVAGLPSAEFTESFVIFLYGASNVFLEHLSAWGTEWSPMDLEHVSITIMFFGGGLLGMLVESNSVRKLLNTSVELHVGETENSTGFVSPQEERWSAPSTYKTSLNPLPALVIFLLGVLMSSHHQDSATSTAVHSQWGMLFTGFAVARLATYVTMYLRPPTSYFPSRPPTELIASFCLICGGLIFMASTRDVIKILDRNGLHAMFVLTVTIGFTCLVMAWTVILYGIRGWAARREASRAH